MRMVRVDKLYTSSTRFSQAADQRNSLTEKTAMALARSSATSRKLPAESMPAGPHPARPSLRREQWSHLIGGVHEND
jgi:hypothetical protein